MAAPAIRTAVPKRRYQLGDHQLVVLGEIDSGDGIDYRYIVAAVREGQARPHIFVACERNTTQPGAGRWQLRLIAENLSQVMATGDEYGDLDALMQAAAPLLQQALALGDEPLLPLG